MKSLLCLLWTKFCSLDAHNKYNINITDSSSSSKCILIGTPWEYRPRDDLRDVHTGYCGISNLGATCYMASTLQQLYMIPPLRNAILAQDPSDVTPRHSSMFRELQRLFLHLWLSRRGTFNPEKFCAEYIFDQHQLNPLEQRDMNEFFTGQHRYQVIQLELSISALNYNADHLGPLVS